MAPSRPEKKGKSDAGTLLDDVETLFEVGNIDEAIGLAEKALTTTGPGGDFELRALNLLALLHIEDGEIDEARSLFERAANIDKNGDMDEKVGGGPEKFLFLAELSEEGGQDTVKWFDRGAAALRKQIQNFDAISNKTPEQQNAYEEKQKKLGGVLCAVTEVYMTDLSWEEDAEQRCEALITEAMMIAPGSSETWQTVANVRISQERTDEARAALKRGLELWQDLGPEDPAVPDFPTRISLARLLLETGMMEDALFVLERLVTDDDESIEAWYLGGWALYLAGEKLRDAKRGVANGSAEPSEDLKVTWKSSRRWLAQCLKLFEAQEYEDERLGEHAVELVLSINKEIGEPEEGEDEWDVASDDEEDEEEDEEMKD
ncbi:Tetratricopeptide-like helical [Cordyceps fumosorosea ARSEF 2679]|uniref:Tetratricopeptide-like helical n=1 Tax=Cordyceps fumosorosea (strain ARSEF 2679) TaxID=1081104 RepID=A0A167XG70_CORFA|nr:Tetratricopeptide-like helical [Cordyceps fumosorosea ARSEF 2679]OAA64943.1 Tetratricopeptide-like helical [Cordyceps fumosorosea ARSEF 2679]